MMILSQDSPRMPAEYEKHRGSILIWPRRSGSFGIDRSEAEEEFANIINILSDVEDVYLLCYRDDVARIKKMVSSKVQLFFIETNDAWARDIMPTFIHLNNEIHAVLWGFNAWGGLYKDYEKDVLAKELICKELGIKTIDARDFILEGGSIHSDGCGRILTTSSCLLNKNRNPSMTKTDIELRLKKLLGAEEILWLPRGIFNDETSEHVDNVACFNEFNEIILASTNNKNDEQYELFQEDLSYIKGKGIEYKLLSISDKPFKLSKEDILKYSFEDGEDEREVGERLALSYVNFYYANEIVLLPQFGNEFENDDRRALEELRSYVKDRDVIPVKSRKILQGGGNIHCVTQQIVEV